MIGNYGGLDPEIERLALRIMKLKPYYGATQIVPRGPYAMFAFALSLVVKVISKAALDIRLCAVGGLGKAILQESFGGSQKGSSRKPDKKNTIWCEQLEGMARMAEHFAAMLYANTITWRERAIEQSCVERVAWPDLFHVFCQSAKVITKMMKGLQVYPDHMFQEIVDNCGCYVTGAAKDFIRNKFAELGLSADDAYHALQFASFNVFAPRAEDLSLRNNPPHSVDEADWILHEFLKRRPTKPRSIAGVLISGKVRHVPDMDVSVKEVAGFNKALRKIFMNPATLRQFMDLFKPSYWLRNEAVLYRQILGE